MKEYTYIPLEEAGRMKSYSFKVVFEKDKWPYEPDANAIWRAYAPALPAAHAWGNTQQEAFENLKNAVDLVVEDLLEHGEPIPEEPQQQVHVSNEPLVTVTV